MYLRRLHWIGHRICFTTSFRQAIAGIFIFLARPIRIGYYATLGGETGIIEDISSMFTILEKMMVFLFKFQITC